ncbi:alkaline phosphatase family protein [Halorubrum trueperi]|uniref:Alkaline phosphatase family protein n=1 Tax=Halorubrum trueperi TaxID=2004704 RepID=A0ABD5UR72_9EURY
MTATSTSGLDTLVVGIDAMSRDVLSRLPDGTTPTVDALVAGGTSGDLEAQLPPWTPSAWPSIYTGVNPGKHGVYGFLRFEGYDWKIVDATDVREHAIWELLSREGYRSVVVNVPVTEPPAAFDGALIPGFTAAESPTCHPDGLLDEVRESIGEYRLYNTQLTEGATRDERVDGYEELIHMRGDAFRYLLSREDPDFGFLQFQQSDTVFHEFPADDDATSRVYAAIDDEIARILEDHDPTNVVLVSDHGIGPCERTEFRANAFLRDRGYAETAADAEKPSWSRLATETLRNGERPRRAPSDGMGDESDARAESSSVAARALSAAARVGLTSQRIGAALAVVGLDDAVLRLVPGDLVRAGSEHVDFGRSQAYVRDRIELGVRINLSGREPAGVVEPEAYDRVRSELIAALTDLRAPDGDPVFDAVIPREDAFSGPYVDDAPDIITVPKEFDVFLSASVLDDAFGEPREPWTHKLHGLVAVSGPGIPASETHGAHALDVAPSVLSLLGAPVSDRMDGSALPVIEETDPTAYPPYAGGGDDADRVGAEVTDRLSNLGYLE